MNKIFKQLFILPTPAEMLQTQLAAAERERVAAEMKVEEWNAHLELQCARITRIKNQLQEMVQS